MKDGAFLSPHERLSDVNGIQQLQFRDSNALRLHRTKIQAGIFSPQLLPSSSLLPLLSALLSQDRGIRHFSLFLSLLLSQSIIKFLCVQIHSICLEIFGGLNNVLGMALGAEDTPPPPKPALTFGQPGSGPGSAQKSRSGGQGSKVQGEERRPREADSGALSGQGRGIRLSRYCVQPGKIKSQDCLLAPRRARHQCDSEERPGRSGLRKVKNDTSEQSQLIQELRLRWRGGGNSWREGL